MLNQLLPPEASRIRLTLERRPVPLRVPGPLSARGQRSAGPAARRLAFLVRLVIKKGMEMRAIIIIMITIIVINIRRITIIIIQTITKN